MKKLLGLSCILLAVAACQQNDKGYTITGKINGTDTGWVFLTHRTDGKYVSDSTRLQQGKFTFTGKVDEPTLYYLNLSTIPQELDLFVDNAKINIVASKDSLSNAYITGSPSQDQFADYNKLMKPFNDSMNALYKVYEASEKNGTLKRVEDSLDNVADNIDSLQTKALESFVKNNPQSVVGAWAVIRSSLIYNPDPLILESLYASLDSSVQRSSYGKKIDTTLMTAKRVAIGQPAPDFIEMDTSGHSLSLSSLKGKYVLIDFWASWCGPCRHENPNVVKAYNKYKDDGFTILGVSLDKNKDAWIKAIHDDHLDWNQVSDLKFWNSKDAKLYGVQAIPSNFLLDKNGIIIGRNLRGDDLENKLAAIFKNQ